MQYTVTMAVMRMSLLDLRGYEGPEPQLLKSPSTKTLLPMTCSQPVAASGRNTNPDCFWTHRILVGPLATLAGAFPPTILGQNVLWGIIQASLFLPSFLFNKVRPASWSDGWLNFLDVTCCLPKHVPSTSNPVLISFIIMLADPDA